MFLMELPIAAQTTWHDSDDKFQSDLMVKYQNEPSGIYLDLKFGFNSDSLKKNGFKSLNSSSSGELSWIVWGKYRIPILEKLIALPTSGSFSNTYSVINQFKINDFRLEDEFGTEINPELSNLDSNDDSFLLDLYYSHCKLIDLGFVRGQRLGKLLISPFSIDTIRRQVFVDQQVIVNIVFDSLCHNFSNTLKAGFMNDGLSSVVINTEANSSDKLNKKANLGSVNWYNITSMSQLNSIKADYLIISGSQYFSYQNEQSPIYWLANHRATHNGFDVAILDVSQIVSDPVGLPFSNVDKKYEQRIRECIKRIYDNGLATNTYDGRLGYVLLVGDGYVTTLPNAFTKGVPPSFDNVCNGNVSVATDYYYSCLTETNGVYDNLPDVGIGRFPVDNTSELSNLVIKTIDYETSSIISFRKGLYITGEGIGPGPDNYFNAPNGFNNQYLPSLITSPNEFVVKTFNTSPSATINDVLDVINQGVNLVSFYGHTNHYTFLGRDTTFYKNNFTNYRKCPVFMPNSCFIGYYPDDVVNTNDCFSEVMLTYSMSEGFVATFASCSTVQLEYSNLPIVPITFYEQFQNGLWRRLGHTLGVLANYTKIITIPPYPVWAPTVNTLNYNLLGDPALEIFPDRYEISQNLTLGGDIYISNEVHVSSGNTLTFLSNSHVIFIDNGSLTIDNGASFSINTGVTFTGSNSNNYLNIQGTANSLSNLHFDCEHVDNWNVKIEHYSAALTMNNCNFSNTNLQLYDNGWGFSILENTFSNSDIFTNSNIDFSHNILNNSTFYANSLGGSKSASCNITYNSIVNTGDKGGFSIEDYPIFNVTNNLVSTVDAIPCLMIGCGVLNYRTHLLKANDFSSYSLNGNSFGNIELFNSIAILKENYCHNGVIGLGIHNSNVQLEGNATASNSNETQRFVDNSLYQIYISELSIAPYIGYNAIFKSNNSPALPYIYYAQTNGFLNPNINVRYNYWGNAFNSSLNLVPVNKFYFTPVWSLPFKNSVDVITSNSDDKLLWSLDDTTKVALLNNLDSDSLDFKALYSIILLSKIGEVSDLGKCYSTIERLPSVKNVDRDYLVSLLDIELLKRDMFQSLSESSVKSFSQGIRDGNLFYEDSLYSEFDLFRGLTALKTVNYSNSISLLPLKYKVADLKNSFEKYAKMIDLVYKRSLNRQVGKDEIRDYFNNSNEDWSVKLSPNPLSKILRVDISSSFCLHEVLVTITDLKGQILYGSSLNLGVEKMRSILIDRESVFSLTNSQVVLVTVQSGTRKFVQKVLIL